MQPLQVTYRSSLSRTAPWAGKGQAHRLTPTATAPARSESRPISRMRPSSREEGHIARIPLLAPYRRIHRFPWPTWALEIARGKLDLVLQVGQDPAAAGRRFGHCRRRRQSQAGRIQLQSAGLAAAGGAGVRDCTWPARPGAAGRPAGDTKKPGNCRASDVVCLSGPTTACVARADP